MISDVPADSNTQPESAVAQPTRLFNRNYLLLWQGQAVSRIGDQVFTVAMAFWIKDVTGSATLMGLLVALSALPALLLEPIGGTLADRYSRRRIIALSDLISGLAVLTLAAAVYWAPQSTATLVWLFIVSVLLSAINAFFIPAIAASVPDLVPSGRLAGANSMGQLSAQLSLFLGQGLGGVLVRLLGAPLLFLVNGITFLFASFSESLIAIPQRPARKAANWRELLREFQHDLREGLRYVWRAVGLREFLIFSTAINFFSTPILLLLPFYVENTLGVQRDWYGYIVAAYAIGALVGYLFLLMLPLGARARGLVMTLCFILGGVGNIWLGLNTSPLVALVLAFVGGWTSGFVAVNVTTLLQLTTPSQMRGRVFGLLGTLGGAVAPLAASSSGIIADALDQNIPLMYIGCGAITLVLALLIPFNRSYRSFVTYQPDESDAEAA